MQHVYIHLYVEKERSISADISDCKMQILSVSVKYLLKTLQRHVRDIKNRMRRVIIVLNNSSFENKLSTKYAFFSAEKI